MTAFADALIQTGSIRPMIIAMPEGDHSYFMNHAADGPRWDDYVAREVVAYVDAHYRTLPGRDHRAIGGLSMGGEGALQLAINYPEVFSIVGANSLSLHTSLDNAPAYFGDWEYYAHYDPLRLAATGDSVGSLQIWVDVGDRNRYLGAAQQLHEILTARDIDHLWHVYPGVHDNSYWIAHTAEYLTFYSQAFDDVTSSHRTGNSVWWP